MTTLEGIPLPRLKIVHVMLITLVLAIVFFALTSKPTDSVAGVIVIVFLAMVAPILWSLRPNPLKAVLANLPDEPEETIAALEQGLHTANPHDVRTNSAARFRLMELYKVRRRYEEAIDQGWAILRMSGLEDAFESEVRLELAVCLDFLNRADEAEAERMAAEDCLDDLPDSFLGWLARGKLLDKHHRHVEAAAAYEQALESNPPGPTAGRDDLLIRLALAWFNAGRPQETMKWVERALEIDGVSEARRFQAHRLAGIACSNLGRLDEAHHHRQRAHEMAVKEGDPKRVSESLALLGDLQRLCGELDRAEALCLEAESLCPESARTAIVTHAMVLRARGQPAEALARLEQASRVGVLASSFHERRVQAALRTEMATYRAELGRLDEAWDDLCAATAELGQDPKLVLPCEAAWAWLLALRGEREASVQRSELVLHGLDEQPLDASTQLECLKRVGQAWMAIGDYPQAQACWERFLATTHPPIAEPVGRYYLGECRWNLGDPAGALEEFRRAMAPGIDSHHARLAEERTRELSKATESGALKEARGCYPGNKEDRY
jgi:tetratricopeptide (TPR) repeat protein